MASKYIVIRNISEQSARATLLADALTLGRCETITIAVISQSDGLRKQSSDETARKESVSSKHSLGDVACRWLLGLKWSMLATGPRTLDR
jgi:hypothetical protein